MDTVYTHFMLALTGIMSNAYREARTATAIAYQSFNLKLKYIACMYLLCLGSRNEKLFLHLALTRKRCIEDLLLQSTRRSLSRHLLLENSRKVTDLSSLSSGASSL